MIGLSISSSNSDNVKKQTEAMAGNIQIALEAALPIIAKQTAEEVKDGIPEGGGWLDIYRDAIREFELSPSEWRVGAETQIEFTELEAETTLFWFRDGDRAAQILAQYNPWTVDTVPSIPPEGIFADAMVRPASPSEVDHHRARLSEDMNAIESLLSREGIRPIEDELPYINGKIYADLDFLARRLELGLGGFPRSPHWEPAAHKIPKIARSADVIAAMEKALRKGQGPQAAPIEE